MTDEEITLVQADWAIIRQQQHETAARFYTRLFELDPALAPLFTGDMTEHGRHLMAMLDFAIEGLRRRGTVMPGIQALGRRHINYGVAAADYTTFGAAFQWTLARGLGDAYTPAHAAAWNATFSLFASAMRDAATVAQPG